MEVITDAIKQLNEKAGRLKDVEVEHEDVLLALLFNFDVNCVYQTSSVSLLHLVNELSR